jgi:splicing factor 3A subunit 2
VASNSAANRARKQRLAELAMESFDLEKDPYFMRNSVGTYECRLCLTVHKTESNYLAHTQGKRHQTNLARRLQRESDLKNDGERRLAAQQSAAPLEKVPRIGQPGYRVSKGFDPVSAQRYLYFEIDYPLIDNGLQPRHRFMSCYEQKVDPPDDNFQYLLFAALPYETIAFKIPNMPVDRDRAKFVSNWNEEKRMMSLKIMFEKAQ